LSLYNGLAADGGITITLEDSSNGANVKDDVLTAATLYWGSIDYITGQGAGGSTATAYGETVTVSESSESGTSAYGDQAVTATAYGDTTTTDEEDEEEETEEEEEEETVTYDDTS
jgi:hypothetical protein